MIKCKHKFVNNIKEGNLPFEEEEIEIVVLLGEEISQNPSGVCRPDLIGRQGKVNTLGEVPQLGWLVVKE